MFLVIVHGLRYNINKGNSGVCLSDKQGKARAVTLAFPGRYLLAAPQEFLDQSDGYVYLW
jgi:hypothetical protein